MSMKIEDKLFLDRFKVDEESHLKIKDNAVWSSTSDFNVSDVANSIGELDISNNAT